MNAGKSAAVEPTTGAIKPERGSPFDRNQLPSPAEYFAGQGLALQGRGRWRTTECRFHGGSDSMRIEVEKGCWCCMACGVRGGDVLSYHMQAYGLGFVDAARALGAWVQDRAELRSVKPAPLPARDALQVLAFETLVVAMVAGQVARGQPVTDIDRQRVIQATTRIQRIAEAYQ